MAKKPSSYLAGAMVVGTAIGALVGLLVAPKSGRATRQVIKTRASEAPTYLRHQLKGLPERSRLALKGLPARVSERFKKGRSAQTAAERLNEQVAADRQIEPSGEGEAPTPREP